VPSSGLGRVLVGGRSGVRCLTPGAFSGDVCPLSDLEGRMSPEKVGGVSDVTPHQIVIPSV